MRGESSTSHFFHARLESDKRAPSLATLNKIASLLRKDIGYFLEEKEGGFNILLRGVAAGVECAPAGPSIREKDEARRSLTDFLRT